MRLKAKDCCYLHFLDKYSLSTGHAVSVCDSGTWSRTWFCKVLRTSCVCSHSDLWSPHAIASHLAEPVSLLLTSEICFRTSHWEWHLHGWCISSWPSCVTTIHWSISSRFCCDGKPSKKALLRRQFLLAKSILSSPILSWEIWFTLPLICSVTTSHTKFISNISR